MTQSWRGAMTELHPILQYYAKAVPTPPGFTSREIVRRAIEFDGPPRIPHSFIQPLEADVTAVAAGARGDAGRPRRGCRHLRRAGGRDGVRRLGRWPAQLGNAVGPRGGAPASGSERPRQL